MIGSSGQPSQCHSTGLASKLSAERVAWSEPYPGEMHGDGRERPSGLQLGQRFELGTTPSYHLLSDYAEAWQVAATLR